MAKTYYEASLWSPRESWRAIRNLRAVPPKRIAGALAGDREEVFHMALEQSEQLFRAAGAVERESRPILLFYGLGQAGRALAAASSSLSAAEWSASGHGLRAHLNEIKPSEIWSLRTSVTPASRDLFSRVSIALGSATDIANVRLGDAAANTIEFVHEFRDFPTHPRIVTLESVHGLNAWQSEQAGQEAKFPVCVDKDEDLDRFLSTVPALSPYQFWRLPDGTVERDQNGRALLAVPITDLDQDGHGSARLSTRQRYRGHDVAVRSLGEASAEVHPLMVWWLILYPLSMLARYEPRRWQQVLNVRRSTSWSKVEYLCDRALDAVPQLLAEALCNVEESSASA